MYLPTLYKKRGVPVKQAVCAICVDRTHGKTELVRLTHGVTVWLCAGHASREFRVQRSGRDFVVTLMRIWHANGCLTAARHHALDAHLAALRGPEARPRPGSYTWPSVRAEVEERLAAGAPIGALIREVRAGLGGGRARPPSARTIHRWHQDQRWLVRGGDAPP